MHRSRGDAPLLVFLALALVPSCVAPRAAPGLPVGAPGQPGAWTPIGRSVQDRDLLATEIGRGPVRLYLIAGIHGDERSGGASVERVRELLLAEAGRRRVLVRLVSDANPDGTAAGTRGNARGVDLNRNWPARNFEGGPGRGGAPLSEPETAAMYADLIAFEPTLVVVLHAARGGPFVNYDGPATRFADCFARGARRVDPAWHVRPDMGYPTPGSLGSLVGVDRATPILTIECRRGRDPGSTWPALEGGLLELLECASGPGDAPTYVVR